MPVNSFNKEELFYIEQNPQAVLEKLNAIVAQANALEQAGIGLSSYLGNRVFAVNTADTACKVTGVNTDIGDAEAGAENTSTGTATAGGTYTGATDSTYAFEVVTPCTVAGTITGMTFKWRKGSGAWSTAVEANGLAQNIDAGLTIAFAVEAAKDFVAGDSWTVAVTTYKISVATGSYLQAGLKKTLAVVTGKIIPAAHTKVYINALGAVETGEAVPSTAVSLATVVNNAGSVTVTDARKYLV